MFYVVGALDQSLVFDENAGVPNVELSEEQVARRAKMIAENSLVHFGCVFADPIALSQLH